MNFFSRARHNAECESGLSAAFNPQDYADVDGSLESCDRLRPLSDSELDSLSQTDLRCASDAAAMLECRKRVDARSTQKLQQKGWGNGGKGFNR